MGKPERDTQVRGVKRAQYQPNERLQKVLEKMQQADSDAALWEEKGLALAEMGLYREAIEAFSRGMVREPGRGTLYLERGHRYINCGELQAATADLTLASRMRPRDWNVYYHLGLAHYMLGEYDKAENAFRFGMRLSEADGDLVPMLYWCWTVLVHAGKMEDAALLLEKVHAGMNAGDNEGYLKKLLVYKGELTPEMILPDGRIEADVQSISYAYGLSNYYYFLKGDAQKSEKLLDALLRVGAQTVWTSFAYHCAETERDRRAQGK